MDFDSEEEYYYYSSDEDDDAFQATTENQEEKYSASSPFGSKSKTKKEKDAMDISSDETNTEDEISEASPSKRSRSHSANLYNSPKRKTTSTHDRDTRNSFSTLSSSSSSSSSASKKKALINRQNSNDEYSIWNMDELRTECERWVNDLAELINVDKEAATIMLRTYKWNKESLVDAFYSDAGRTLKKCGLSHRMMELLGWTEDENSSKSQKSESKSSSTTSSTDQTYTVNNRKILKECEICGDEDLDIETECYALGCGHYFCLDCWKQYLTQAIRSGPRCVSATCPKCECDARVDDKVYRDILLPATRKKSSMDTSTALSLVSAQDRDVWDRYTRYSFNNFVIANKRLKWCPGRNCDHIIYASGAVRDVFCQHCGYSCCFKCGHNEAHLPVRCEYLAKWMEKCRNESETANYILSHTKPCPKCGTRIEKNQGCNHMACTQCKYDFCWICMGAWADHGMKTGGYYKCNKYVEESTENKS
eukprot:g38.t1